MLMTEGGSSSTPTPSYDPTPTPVSEPSEGCELEKMPRDFDITHEETGRPVYDYIVNKCLKLKDKYLLFICLASANLLPDPPTPPSQAEMDLTFCEKIKF